MFTVNKLTEPKTAA